MECYEFCRKYHGLISVLDDFVLFDHSNRCVVKTETKGVCRDWQLEFSSRPKILRRAAYSGSVPSDRMSRYAP